MSESTAPKPFLSSVIGGIMITALTLLIVGGGFVALLVQGAQHGHDDSASGEAASGEASSVESAKH